MNEPMSMIVNDKYCYIYGATAPETFQITNHIGYSRINEKKGYVQIALSRTNLHKIGQLFNGRAPVVRKGNEHINNLKRKYDAWLDQAEKIRRVLAKPGTLKPGEEPLVIPHGYTFKMPPKDHQHKTFMLLTQMPQLNVMLDCFGPSTLVNINGKYMRIEEAIVGDFVITAKGSAHLLNSTMKPYKGDLVDITTASGFFPLQVTPNHKFPVVRMKKCSVPSRGKPTICSNECGRSCSDKLFENYTIEEVRASELTLNDFMLFPRAAKSGNKKISNSMLRIFGLWLAEGWTRDFNGKPYRVGFGFHVKEKSTLVRQLVKDLKAEGYKPSVQTSKEKYNAVCVSVNSYKLAQALEENCGKLSHGKHLPSWVADLSYAKKILLLKYLFEGDAYIKTKTKGRDSAGIRYVTVSYDLAAGVRDLLLSMGIRCSAVVEEAKVDFNKVSHRQCYRLIIPRKFMKEFGYDVQMDRVDRKPVGFSNDGYRYTLIPIRNIGSSYLDGYVYNMTSSDDDSYLTDAGITKNCGTGKTFILLTSTEYKIQKGIVGKGKTLVSCPLSIMETSWMEDAEKFTNLNVGILWSDKASRREYGEPMVLADHGPKPVYVIGGRKRKGTKFWNPDTNELKKELGSFDYKEQWRKVEYTWHEGKNAETGEAVMYGNEVVRYFETVSRKREHIQKMLADSSYDIYIINHDGIRLHADILSEYGFDQVIIDESTKIKNAQSKTFKAHVKISKGADYRYAMSGTPAPNGAIDLWSQFYFSDRGMTLEPSFKDYRSLFFEKIVLGERADSAGNLHEIAKYVPKDQDALNKIANRLRFGSVRYRQDECLDLPERSNIPKKVQLSAEQTKAYMEMEENLLTEFVDDSGNKMTIEASTILVKALRLRQINSGFASAFDENAPKDISSMDPKDQAQYKKITTFKENPKMETLAHIVDEIGENKIVVVTNYKFEIDMILERFKELNPTSIDGRIHAKHRPQIVRDFQNDDRYRMICLHPQAAGHGITLTKARYMVFFSMTNNYEHEYQVAKRIERIGQQNRMIFYYLQGMLDPAAVADFKKMKQMPHPDLMCTVDHSLYELIREKERVQTKLIDEHPAADFDFTEKLANDVLAQMMRRHDK